MALQIIEDQGFISICLQTEMKCYPASVGVTRGQQVGLADDFGFLDRDYCYKS
jgi:hypothetical protein